MKFTYRLVHDTGGWLAECVESEAMGEGRTREEAIASLRRALEERMYRPDAVAPPASQPRPVIDLTLAPPEPNDADRSGPSDPRPRA